MACGEGNIRTQKSVRRLKEICNKIMDILLLQAHDCAYLRTCKCRYTYPFYLHILWRIIYCLQAEEHSCFSEGSPLKKDNIQARISQEIHRIYNRFACKGVKRMKIFFELRSASCCCISRIIMMMMMMMIRVIVVHCNGSSSQIKQEQAIQLQSSVASLTWIGERRQSILTQQISSKCYGPLKNSSRPILDFQIKSREND